MIIQVSIYEWGRSFLRSNTLVLYILPEKSSFPRFIFAPK